MILLENEENHSVEKITAFFRQFDGIKIMTQFFLSTIVSTMWSIYPVGIADEMRAKEHDAPPIFQTKDYSIYSYLKKIMCFLFDKKNDTRSLKNKSVTY